MKKVAVTGCFDSLHSGHVSFLEEAAQFGDLYVFVGNDKNVRSLKKHGCPVFTEQERLYVIRSIRFVKQAFISSGFGMLDFVVELESVKPDVFVVGEDGDIPDKRKYCQDHGIEYVVLKRKPRAGLPDEILTRSSTALRNINKTPYRIDLAVCRGWLDQPFVSARHPGHVITISIEADHKFDLRSGMATATRARAIELWGDRLPDDKEPLHLAKVLFAYDNQPGTFEFSGSQDAIGITMPGLNRSYYAGNYWPERIRSLNDNDILNNLKSLIKLIPLGCRDDDFAVLSKVFIANTEAKRLAWYANSCWDAIMAKNNAAIGRAVQGSFWSQVVMFPNMINPKIREMITKYEKDVLGYKISGAGGGGYLILISEKNIENAIDYSGRLYVT